MTETDRQQVSLPISTLEVGRKRPKRLKFENITVLVDYFVGRRCECGWRSRIEVNAAAGIDAQSIDEVTASLVEFGTRYTQRLYTDGEIERCERNPERAGASFAICFAAKEAVLKILDVGKKVPPWKDIEICFAGNGKFEITLYGVAANLAQQQGIESMSLSMSHGGGVALAVVVAQKTTEGSKR